MRTTLIILLTLVGTAKATAQQNSNGTITITKTDTPDSAKVDSFGKEVSAGRCISLQPTRFEVGALYNPKKTATVDPPIFSAKGLNFEQYFAKHLRYPKQAEDSNITGVVELDFMVDVSGFTRGIIVRKGIGYGCDKEALRVLRRMPKWTPAKVNGETVVCRLTREIMFNRDVK